MKQKSEKRTEMYPTEMDEKRKLFCYFFSDIIKEQKECAIMDIFSHLSLPFFVYFSVFFGHQNEENMQINGNTNLM